MMPRTFYWSAICLGVLLCTALPTAGAQGNKADERREDERVRQARAAVDAALERLKQAQGEVNQSMARLRKAEVAQK